MYSARNTTRDSNRQHSCCILSTTDVNSQIWPRVTEFSRDILFVHLTLQSTRLKVQLLRVVVVFQADTTISSLNLNCSSSMQCLDELSLTSSLGFLAFRLYNDSDRQQTAGRVQHTQPLWHQVCIHQTNWQNDTAQSSGLTVSSIHYHTYGLKSNVLILSHARYSCS